MRLVTHRVCTAALIFPAAIWACGPSFPPYYLVMGNESLVLELPATVIGERHVQQAPTLIPARWETSLDADLQQLADALAHAADAAVLESYANARKRAREPYIARLREQYPYRYTLAPPSEGLGRSNLEHLEAIPPEFMLYLRGTRAYYRNDYELAIAQWSRILALPEDERHYRTTWAAFMIGKAYLHVDPRSAIRFFQQTRAFAQAGFPDPLELAQATIGWQAKAEQRLGHYFEAARLYTMSGDHVSRSASLSDALTQTDVDPRVFEDPFIRPHALALLENGSLEGDHTLCVYRLAQEIVPESVERMPGHLAHALYRRGNFQAAADWAAEAPHDPNARWVRSKLLLREGEIDKGIVLLRDLLSEFPTFSAPVGKIDDGDLSTPVNPFCSDLGVLLLAREEYVAALDALARGGYYADAAYVAECVLTPDELREYLKDIKNNRFLRERMGKTTYRISSWSAYDYLADIYARRMARNGKWLAARDYYPESAVSPIRRSSRRNLEPQPVRDIADNVISLEPAEGSQIERGMAGVERATLIRVHGLELMGTECAPDWASTMGQLANYMEYYEPPPRIRRPNEIRRFPRADERMSDTLNRWAHVSETTIAALDASPNEVLRYEASRPSPNVTFHYRYLAADMMWEAAKLLPDNDPRTAEALWTGGSWLKVRDPDSADRFYKALVRRCRKLPIGQRADELRWFPAKLEGLTIENAKS